MATVFICYRREDAPATTGRIYDHLVQSFGAGSVFKDVDSIPVGTDFPSHIQRILRQATAQVVVIGPRWLDIRDEAGRSRLQNPGDFVRQEIETGLASGIPVIPVLVEGATMPPMQVLPASLAPLTRLQAVNIRFDPDFTTDVRRLITAIERVDTTARGTARPGISPLVARTSRTRGRGWLFGGLLVALAVLLVVLAATHGLFQFPAHRNGITHAKRRLQRRPQPTATATATATPVTGAIYLNSLALPVSGWTSDTHCKFLSDGYHDDYTAGAQEYRQRLLRSSTGKRRRYRRGCEVALRPARFRLWRRVQERHQPQRIWLPHLPRWPLDRVQTGEQPAHPHHQTGRRHRKFSRTRGPTTSLPCISRTPT